MLTPKQIDDYPARLVELYNQTECDIIADMAKRMAAKDMFIPSSQWQMDKLLEMGAVQSDIEKRLAVALGKTQSEVHKIITDSGYKALKKDAAIYEKAGIDASQALQSDAVKQALENGMSQTLGTFRNITRTTVNNATMQYYDALDAAYLQVSSGAFNYTTAITNAIKKLSENGIACATYASGHKDYLDVAVRRATLTGLNQAALHAQVRLADELDSDLVEVTAHSGARTGVGVANHARWQGRVYSLSGTSDKYPSLVLETGYGTGAGLGGWNCRHSFFPFIEGVSETAYTDYELAELNAPKYEYNGEKLTEYEATQKQRYIERQIRKYKREVAGLDAAGVDSTDSRNRLAKWQQRQIDFIEQTGLKRDYNREVVEGYSSKAKKSGKSADNSNKSVAKGEKSGIIEMYGGKGIDVTSDSKISSKIIKQVKKATKKVTSDFKVLESYSEPIVFGDVDGGLAKNDYDPKTGLNIITLRKSDFANPDSLLKKLNADYVSGFSYETNTIQSLVAHEMGHNAHIALALKRAHLPYGVPLTAEQYVAFVNEYNKIRQEIYAAAFNGESLVEIKELCVSELGRSTENNANELIAQSFGNYYYGRKKSAIANKIINYFKKGLK